MRIEPNPYVWHRVSLDLFYGRQPLVDEVIADIKGGRSSAIVGGRKFGKTTLLRKIENDLMANFRQSVSSGILVIPVYIDALALPHPLTPATVYIAIIRQAEYLLKKAGLLAESSDSRSAILDQFPGEENRAFGQVVQSFADSFAKTHYIQLAILLDEVEPIAKSKWADGFFSNWRHLLSNEPEISPHITVVFSGAKEIALLGEEIGSPLLNILTVHELALFSWHDTRSLIKEPTRGFVSDLVARRVFIWSGGHPFLIQYLLHYICRFDTGEAEHSLAQGKREFLKKQHSHFSKWWFEKFNHNDRDVYLYLAARKGFTAKREIIALVGDNAAVKCLAVLCHTGVAKKSESGESYRAAGIMFKQWVEGEAAVSSGRSACDRSIYEKLAKLDPEIATKYVSAWSVHSAELPNYSGSVGEMRDVITLVLHTLAPDHEVMAESGFVPEKDNSGRSMDRPTRRQRSRYAVSKRLKSAGTPLFAEIEVLDRLTEQLGQMVVRGYSEASARTHKLATSEQAWRCLKQMDAILAQLL